MKRTPKPTPDSREPRRRAEIIEDKNARWLTIKNGAGVVTGYIEAFWSVSLKRYVTIPGASKFRNA